MQQLLILLVVDYVLIPIVLFLPIRLLLLDCKRFFAPLNQVLK